jgi:D-glycero-D-manno-heptose 1,7-bisphosphate phosphatase
MQGILGGAVDAFRYCPHHPEATVARYRVECRCRKPAPGMIEGLLDEYPIRRRESFLVGDRDTDLEAAAAAGIRGYQFSAGSLDVFVERILRGAG